jgi:hypothetical protein
MHACIHPCVCLCKFCTLLCRADGFLCNYEASASSVYSDSSGIYGPWRAFDSNYANFWHSATGTYTSDGSTFTATTASTTVGSETVRGEWIQIKLPQAYTVKWYQVTPRAANQNEMLWGAAKKWRVVATNDGTTW